MGKSTEGCRSAPSRRSVLAGLASAGLAGCAGGAGGGSDLATAVIGLRIENTPALQTARASYRWSVPLWSFASRDPTANLTFGQVDPATGAIDLPMFPGLHNVKAQVETRGYGTALARPAAPG